MGKLVVLLILVFLSSLIPAVILRTIYGPSYYYLSGEDCWMPDGDGGWVKHGVPGSPPPDEPSVNIPVPIMYIPVLLAVLVGFYCFYLSKKFSKLKTDRRV
ncbi:MAG: hypothetical protein ACYTBJ_21920 [Planctomycetota bacterium]